MQVQMIDVLFGIALLGIMFLLTTLVHKQKIGTTFSGLLLLVAVLSFRGWYMPQIETGPDASIWLASANTVSILPDSIWSLLTTNEARPLTVLPLVLLHKLGMPLTYPAADIVGIIMYGLSFIIAISIMRQFVSSTFAFILALPLFATIATTSIIDYTSYNCQAPSLLIIMISLYLLLKMHQQGLPIVSVAILGLFLGSLPLIKFQNAPAGIAIGIAACLLCIKQKKISSLFLLMISAMIPVSLVALFFIRRGLWDDFMNDYFNNYFYYAYSQEYAGDSFWHRYNPRRIVSFMFRTTDSLWLLLGTLFTLVFVTVKRKFNITTNVFQWFALVFLALNFYAVIQSGWNTPHYLFYLWIPPILYLSTLLPHASYTKWIMAAFIGMTVLQTLHNQSFRKISSTQWLDEDAAIEQQIMQLTKPEESIVVWGHADRYYVETKRPMGVRLADSWWVVQPGPLQPKRIAEYLYDFEKNKPRLLVDNTSGPDPHHFEMKAAHLHAIPAISQYVQQHYECIDSLYGAKFYLRKK